MMHLSRLGALLLTLLPMTINSHAQLPEEPDFAFPQKVIGEAEAVYRSATGLERMQAAMQIATARTAISPDSAFAMPAFIAGTARTETNPAAAGLLTLYQARLLTDIYTSNKYKYDKVQAPSEPLPAEVSQWSGEQFRSRISALTDSALTILTPSYRTPIGDYDKVIETTDESRRYYPTLLDFAALAARTNYNAADNQEGADKIGTIALDNTPAGSLRHAIWLVKTQDSEAQWKAYESNPHGEAAGYLLYNLVDIPGHNLVETMRGYLADNPSGAIADAVRDKYIRITRPKAIFECVPFAAPGEEIKVAIDYEYTREAGLNLYRILNPTAAQSDRKLKKVAEYTISTDSLRCDKATLAITIDTEGWYVLRPTVNGQESTNQWIDMTLHITPFVPFALSLGGRYAAVLTHYADGAPVSGAAISLYSDNRDKSRVVGTTGSDGVLMFDFPKALAGRYNGAHPISATVGGKKYFFGNNFRICQWSSSTYYMEHTKANFYLDRPIYRPGETVDWCIAAVNINPKAKTSALAADMAVSVVIYDANYDELDTVKVRTDRYGRASGSFVIPEGRLTGNYHLTAYIKDKSISSAYFMVSDFKAPVFEVTDVKTVRATDTTRSVTVTGIARTYAGMPVANANVNVSVSEMPRWRWFFFQDNNSSEKGSVDGTTDTDGRFSIVIDGAMLEADEDYSAKVTVTSEAAETASATTHFTTGKPYTINLGAVKSTYCTDSAFTIPVKAYGPDGSEITLPVEWQLTSGDVLLEGHGDITKKGLIIDLPEAPAEQYDIKLIPADTAICDISTMEKAVTLYSLRRNLVPDSECLLLPQKRFMLAGCDEVEATVGVPRDTYIYMYHDGAGCEVLEDVRMVMLKAGFNKVRLTATKGSETSEIKMICVHNGKIYSETVELNRLDNEITLKAESMRDRLVPGAPETWRFTLSRADGKPVSGAMIATMYNHALDAFGTSYDWSKKLPRFTNYNFVRTDELSRWLSSTQYRLDVKTRNIDLSFSEPYFRYIPGSAGTMSGVHIRGGYATMKRAALTGSVNGITAEGAEEEIMDMDMAVTMPPEDGLEEVVAVAYATTGSSPKKTEAQINDVLNSKEFSFRSGEVQQAFWMPDICVNERGEAVITFTTPDAIGTWRLNALAWNESLRSSLLTRDFVASKPLMVQPNAPRFLRDGDQAQVIATVYNNTDSTATISSIAEFFDISTSKILASDRTTSVIAPNASAQVGCLVEVPAGISMIGYRVKSASADFTDGEQIAIPVLASGATVIDTDNFVLTPDTPTFTTTLPENSSIIALQYCQNPVWDAVRALPDLLADVRPVSSPQAAQLVYGALTARGMHRQFPEIKRAIDTWSANPADSALVSDLMKNEDIKMALLAQTPWLSAAGSQNERMARLKSVFDEGEIASSLSRAVKALQQLRRPDGGYAWGSWSDQSSLWATNEVAWSLGHAKMQGYLPAGSGAERIAREALSYIDSHIKDNDDTGYALLLSFYPGYKPTTVNAEKAVNRAVQYILKNWRNASTAAKARYALVLESRDYHAVAAEIMQSVREFATTDSYGAVSFPSVRSVYDYTFIIQAFARISPDETLLDGIRRHVILRTQVSDDLGTCYPAPLIAAVLASGAKWTSLPENTVATVTVDGRNLTLDKMEYATGSISKRIPATDGGKTITVTRSPEGPVSYGSVTSVSAHPAIEVKPSSCHDLSIEKRLIVERNGKWIETGSVQLGEKCRVQLLVVAGKDLDYVTVNDERAAALEPVDQLPGYVYASGLAFYRENSDSRTRLFISRLPKGTYYITYDMTAATAGTYSSGIATAQSQYAPEIVAHSGGSRLTVK